jgi:hypothetical protein
MGGHDARRNGQAQPAAAPFTGAASVKPDEAFEDPVTVRRRNGVAIVVDGDNDAVPEGVEVHCDS